MRKFSSADKPQVTEEDLKKQLIPLYWLRPFRSLPSAAGMHRWVWDLHYPTPEATRHEYPISAIPGDTPRLPLGPTALPGTYTVKLTADGKSYTASFAVKMDPRVKTSAAALEKKLEFETRLASWLSETSQAVLQAGSIREPLQKLSEQSTGPVRDSVQAFQNKLAAVLGAPAGFAAPPSNEITLSRVNGQIAILYGQVWQVDAEPTTSQSEAAVTIDHDASDVMKRWEALRTTDLSALNRALGGANLPEVKIDSDPHQEETNMDEE